MQIDDIVRCQIGGRRWKKHRCCGLIDCGGSRVIAMATSAIHMQLVSSLSTALMPNDDPHAQHNAQN